MGDIKARIDEMVNELKQDRDELQVKLSLAKLEMRDDWRSLEAKLGELEAKAGALGEATVEASKDIGSAAKLLGEEIRDGLKKIASHF